MEKYEWNILTQRNIKLIILSQENELPMIVFHLHLKLEIVILRRINKPVPGEYKLLILVHPILYI